MKNAIFAVVGALVGLAIQAAGMQLTLAALLTGWDGPFSGGGLFAALTLLLFLLPTGVCAGAVARRYLFLVPALLLLAVGWEMYLGISGDVVDTIAGNLDVLDLVDGLTLFLWAGMALAVGIVQGCRLSWWAWPKSAAETAGKPAG